MTEFVKVQTSDNFILQGLLSIPTSHSNEVILHIHGMAGNFYENAFIEEMAKEYPKNEITFCSVNNRGHDYLSNIKHPDGSSQRVGSAYEIFEDCILDIEAWINFLYKKGFKKIHLQGHSLGCPKVIYYQAQKQDQRIGTIILLSLPDMYRIYLQDFKNNQQRVNELEKLKSLKDKDILGRWIWGEYPLSKKTYLNFFQKNSNVNIFPISDKNGNFSMLAKIKNDLILISGSKNDAVVGDVKECLEIVKSKAISSNNVQLKIIEGAEHGFEGFEKELVSSVVNFLI